MLDVSEVEALNSIVRILDSLRDESRTRVMLYLRGRLDALGTAVTLSAPQAVPRRQTTEDNDASVKRKIVDIRQLRSDKSPRSDVEMAALVGYYLQEDAPPNERKNAFGRDDLEKYFKQAGHPLPKSGMTLTNAKNAGYLDLVSPGEYRLNAVGYNLVAHTLPTTAAGGRTPRAKPRSKRNVSKRSPTASAKPSGSSRASKKSAKGPTSK